MFDLNAIHIQEYTFCQYLFEDGLLKETAS